MKKFDSQYWQKRIKELKKQRTNASKILEIFEGLHFQGNLNKKLLYWIAGEKTIKMTVKIGTGSEKDALGHWNKYKFKKRKW